MTGPATTASFTCSVCGRNHQGAPLSWGPDAPDAWAALASGERESRGECGTDQCVIDEKHFFIRGRIEIPVTDTGETFAWLVWVRVSAPDFFRMSDMWTVDGREMSPPYSAALANLLPLYSEPTLGLSVRLHTRPVGVRPFVEILGDHSLRGQQRNGISSHEVQAIADKFLKLPLDESQR
ncbi:MAG TPA: DUF2199 domain-containing protein [Candidatus Aquilonibacter sp.]|nr:DUF2199 domain-containing protein [Candidatus Aquilonibacter sp.]